jgi:hypothetical protein
VSRSLQAAVLAAIAGTELRPVLLYHGVWASGDVRFWTGLGQRSWDGETWTGIGSLGRIADVVETTETRIEGVTVELDGVPSSQISSALGQARHGLAGTLYFGTVDASDVLTADVLFRGRMDVVSIEDSADTAKIVVRYLSRLADMRKASGRRFTAEDLRAEYAGDAALDGLTSVQDVQIQWGGGWRWP